MAHDLKAICDAYATRYGAITKPSAAAESMKAAFGQTPASIPNTPAVYIEVTDGDIVPGSQVYAVTHHLVINFLLSKAPGDPAKVEKQRQIWLPSLLAVTFNASYFALGLAPDVKSAIPAKYEFAEIDAAGQLYDGIRIFADVIVRDIAFT